MKKVKVGPFDVKKYANSKMVKLNRALQWKCSKKFLSRVPHTDFYSLLRFVEEFFPSFGKVSKTRFAKLTREKLGKKCKFFVQIETLLMRFSPYFARQIFATTFLRKLFYAHICDKFRFAYDPSSPPRRFCLRRGTTRIRGFSDSFILVHHDWFIPEPRLSIWVGLFSHQ